MTILLLGSGGREHAFAYKLSQSKMLSKLFIAPGNAGTKECGENVAIDIKNFDAIKQFVLTHNVNMVIVGPEDPLVNGIYDYFINNNQLKNIPVIGPSKLGATLEGSKQFAKEFMIRNGVPTAKYQSFNHTQLNEALAFLDTFEGPYVLKADGLAAGKGVIIEQDKNKAKAELIEMLANKKFGSASETVVIEEFLKGIELSVFVLTDGKNYKVLPEAKDYKRIGEGDTGLNTGGMGAVSPVPFADKAFMERVENDIVKPTIDGFVKEKIDYKGFVFIGLMNNNGIPKVIEYNVRMGDPETEVVFPRIESDFVELFDAVAQQKLNDFEFKISDKTAATVIVVSGGYPEDYEKGKEISGLKNCEGSLIFHAGTSFKDNKLLTNGGRVLAFTSMGDNLSEALKTSYSNINKICYEGIYYRKDIGQDLLKLM